MKLAHAKPCARCRAPMDEIDHVYCCVCTPRCRFWICWARNCHRVWIGGPCARSFLRELMREANLEESYTTSDRLPPPR